MAPIILACHFSAKRLSTLRVIAMRLGVRVRAVDTWEYLQPIGTFTGDCSGFDALYDQPSFPDELIVFAHFSEELLNHFLQELQTAKLSVPLKCVLTESNKGWNVLELRKELMAERDALQNSEQAHP